MRRPPVYPVLISVAVVLATFAEEAVLVTDVLRPTLVFVLVVVLAQSIATVVLRDREKGAIVGAIAFMAIASPVVAFAGLVPFALFVTGPGILARTRGSAPRPNPWAVGTNALDLIAIILMIVSFGGLLLDGRLDPPRDVAVARSAVVVEGSPDIIVILVDGHPRWDTVRDLFASDPEPFLASMQAQGFDIARKSRSNYNRTALTLASMFQMRQVRDIPEVAPLIGQITDQKMGYLLMNDVLRGGAAFSHLHELGYEIVAIPSEFSRLAIPADRSVDSGHLGVFDADLATISALRLVDPDFIRTLFAEQHRRQVIASFQSLVDLAREPHDAPRFVFAHIVSPHSPTIFGPAGAPVDGPTCFPTTCNFWANNTQTGPDDIAALVDQVAYIDQLVVQTTRSILAASVRPPVIIVMSDHGSRYDAANHEESLRSLFVSYTPGHPDLFPDDPTPVDLFPRLLNGYAGTTLPMSSEESYWADLTRTQQNGLFMLEPVKPDP